jgi:hypothetical protein
MDKRNDNKIYFDAIIERYKKFPQTRKTTTS